MRKDQERITITYDVETWGAEGTTELPFVVGVLGDFSGQNQQKPAFKDRRFVRIDKENFNATMAKIAPSVSFKIDDPTDEDKEIAIDLTFSKMEDFHPDQLVEQVPHLRDLIEMRRRLRKLGSIASNSPEFRPLLEQILADEEKLRALGPELAALGKKGE